MLGGECDEINDINPLLVDWKIPLNNHNFVFSGQGNVGTNNVGIGINDCTPLAKLDVLINSGVYVSAAVRGMSVGAIGTGFSYGVYGESCNAHISVGVEGRALSPTAFKNNGGRFFADSAAINYAGYFEALSSNPNSINNYGVYAVCPPIVTGASGNWAGYFNGHVHVVGNITYTGGLNYVSDQQFKQNINNYTGAIEIIRELRPVTFLYDTVNYDLNFPAEIQYGLIAQEVEPFLPELVSDQIIPAKFDTAGNIVSESIPYKGLNYQQLIPIILKAIKELDETIGLMQTTEEPILKGSAADLKYINDSLIGRLIFLENRLNNLEEFVFNNLGENQTKNMNDPAFQQEVTLENTKAIVLNQNHPNPFKEQTTISFLIPDNIASAKIIFIDNLGNVLKQVEINDRGFGELIVYAHDLSAGHYTYYLIADGKTIESKKMVLTK